MSWLYELRNIIDKYPVIWLVLFVLLSVLVELFVYAFTKKIQKKSAILSLVASATITASIAAIFSLGLGNPVIKNNESVIPSDLYRSQYKIVLYDYYGEYYYPPNSKETYFITGDFTDQATKIELINEDYDVLFNTYSVEKTDKGLYEYVFDNIPIGNYVLNISVEGYLNRSERVVLETAGLSTNFKTGSKWWSIYPIMEKNDAGLAYPMNVWFIDSNENPVHNISYEFIRCPKYYGMSYTYPQKTADDGSINENIRIIDNKKIWIAYINPYTGAEEIICVTAKVDRDDNKCDAILMFDEKGNLKQTSPKELWYYRYN